MLEQELAYYDAQLSDWLQKYPERFVLVKGEQLIGTYDTYEDALADGARRFGATSFLVRRVQAQQPIANAPALTLGLLRAHH